MAADLDQITQAFIDGIPSLTPEEERLGHSIYRLLARGRPAALEMIAGAAGWSADAVAERLDSWGAVFRDRRGAVVGFWGFAIEELTGHRMDLGELGGGWGWCAYDTLFIPHLLDVTASVISLCPTTGQPVRLRVSRAGATDLAPAEAMVSMLAPDGPIDDNVLQTLCHFIHFFASPVAAEEWTAAHPGSIRVTVAHAFEMARRQNAAVYPTLVGAAV